MNQEDLKYSYDTLKYVIQDVNVFGVRNTISKQPNTFDDTVGVWIPKDNILQTYRATTDPGSYWLLHPMQVKGTAIVCERQHIKSHMLGRHDPQGNGGYPALVQRGMIKIYRDADKDAILDMDPNNTTEGNNYGINIHHAGVNSINVDNWSAGCQVIANLKDWNTFYQTVVNTSTKYGQKQFHYTLFTDTQIVTKPKEVIIESKKIETAA